MWHNCHSPVSEKGFHPSGQVLISAGSKSAATLLQANLEAKQQELKTCEARLETAAEKVGALCPWK